MSQREELLSLIKDKKTQLSIANKGTEGWKRGKSKFSGTAQISKISVLTLQKEIRDLSEQVRQLDRQ